MLLALLLPTRLGSSTGEVGGGGGGRRQNGGREGVRLDREGLYRSREAAGGVDLGTMVHTRSYPRFLQRHIPFISTDLH